MRAASVRASHGDGRVRSGDRNRHHEGAPSGARPVRKSRIETRRRRAIAAWRPSRGRGAGDSWRCGRDRGPPANRGAFGRRTAKDRVPRGSSGFRGTHGAMEVPHIGGSCLDRRPVGPAARPPRAVPSSTWPLTRSDIASRYPGWRAGRRACRYSGLRPSPGCRRGRRATARSRDSVRPARWKGRWP